MSTQQGLKNSFLYFAYGSNLLTKRIHYQNPSARSKGPALLKDYKLEFRLPSKRWKGHAATITKSPGDEVWGVLWELDNEHRATLDNQEGVDRGLYQRIDLKVLHNDHDIDVISYQVLPDQMDQDVVNCKPSKVYKDVIVEGAKENGLPEDYQRKLQEIVDNGYAGEVAIGLPLHLKD